MVFTPRVSQILFLLLNNEKPLSVKELAEQLHISRRTIYRELEDINRQLQKYHIVLETIPGKGMVLGGSEDGKRVLMDEIKVFDSFDPKNKDQRLNRLTLELLKQKEPRKLFYYALLLQVSKTTVNNDLEALAQWFREVHLIIKKRPGLGIYLEGSEQDYREACLRYMNENREDDFLLKVKNRQKSNIYELFHRYYVEVIYEILRKRSDSSLRKFTEDSLITFLCYLALTVQRILEKHEILESKIPDFMISDEKVEKNVEEIIEELEHYFYIHISDIEFQNICIYFKGAKLQYFNKEEFIENEYEVKCLVLEMLQCFEPDLRVRLKNDDEFLQALTAHLKPTIIRLQHNIKIENPFMEDVKEMYPVVYQKAEAAAKVLHQHLGFQVPEEEIGMLAIHFGGAIVRHQKDIKYRRKVEIGVVCSSGIGISRLLASRLENVFQDDVNITILIRNKLTKEVLNNIDFLVSTFDLSYVEKESVEVNPMLNKKDLENIHHYINYYSEQASVRRKKDLKQIDLLKEVDEAVAIGNDIRYILKDFAFYNLNKNVTLEDVVTYAGQVLGNDERDARIIYEAIMEREQLASQIVPELKMALLHARTKGTQYPRFILIFPEGERFIHKSLKGIKVVMVMLLPDTEAESKVLVAVSNAIFDHDEFMEAIVQNDRIHIQEYLQFYLREFLQDQLKSML